MEAHDQLAPRVRRLEGWQRDAAGELGDLHAWRAKVEPMLEGLSADMHYRQRRHAETMGRWSFGRVLLVTLLALYMALLQTVTVALALGHLWGH